MMETSDAGVSRLDLLDRATRYATDDYDLVSATFAALDSKAQATFGVSGVFVAGTVALLNSLRDPSDGSGWAVAAVFATYVLLVGAIVTSILALKVREVATPISSASISQTTLEMVDLPDEELIADMRAGWYREQLRVWGQVIERLEKTNSEKALLVGLSQLLLVAAIIFAGFATLAFGAS
jgi:hypothetical protein